MGIRQAKKKAVAGAVLKSAQRLFLERGVDQTSMEAIAEVAGISRASLFNYYNGKDAILTALAARL